MIPFPFLSTIVIFKKPPFSLGFWRFSGTKDPWKEWGMYPWNFRTYVSGDWDVHWGYGVLTHGLTRTPMSLTLRGVFSVPLKVFSGLISEIQISRLTKYDVPCGWADAFGKDRGLLGPTRKTWFPSFLFVCFARPAGQDLSLTWHQK